MVIRKNFSKMCWLTFLITTLSSTALPFSASLPRSAFPGRSGVFMLAGLRPGACSQVVWPQGSDMLSAVGYTKHLITRPELLLPS